MRLDRAIVLRGLTDSRAKAASVIAEGRVTVNGKIVTKAAFETEETDVVSIAPSEEDYVSRAGRKLASALDAFGISPEGKTVVDVGASTGGFTDCLLRRGADFVYAVDVGTGQLSPSLARHPKVRNMEKTNARTLTKDSFDRPVDMAVMDVSFISQSLLYPAVSSLLPSGGPLVTLVKPQFEVGPEGVGKNGIVRDPDGKRIREIMKKLTAEAERSGLAFERMTDSPIPGGDGNREYLALFRKG